MRSTRGPWIRLLVTGLSVVAASYWLPASARAQGFGPDPFKPFNKQFEQFVYPNLPGPAGGAGQRRSPGSRDNQMQQYYDELEGANRLSSERFSPGLPYWKVRTNAERDRQERLSRRERLSEDTPAAISQKYLAYFSEPNPRKRAILMREFTPVRRGDERDGLARGPNGADNRETALGLDAGRRSRRGDGGPSGVGGRARGSSRAGEEKSGRGLPPAPPIGRLPGTSSRTPRRPSDVLNRSRSSDDDPLDSGLPARQARNRDRPAADRPSDE